ncbi:hypothetical protein E2C01_080247 [Portunus trituberculatus]|uniref:Uncharacterized protein n=1 Tax=Portunus trituberculatus TaxID=210409 RepID=A0A5B7ITK3_PORTR|nr:hypothetical protein [Portunus trituberculatus]
MFGVIRFEARRGDCGSGDPLTGQGLPVPNAHAREGEHSLRKVVEATGGTGGYGVKEIKRNIGKKRKC